MEYPKLANIQHLGNLWSRDKLATYINFGSADNLSRAMLKLITGIHSVIASIGHLSPSSVKSSQFGADQNDTLEATFLQEAEIAQKFCESSIVLFELISERIDCSTEHKLRVHLSGFGRHNQDIEMFFHTCVKSEASPGAYPVHFSKKV